MMTKYIIFHTKFHMEIRRKPLGLSTLLYLGIKVVKVQLRPCDEPQYCNKSFATPKATSFYYQHKIHTNLTSGIVICTVG